MSRRYSERQYIITANVGDSRAVLSRAGKAIPLSNDHKVENPKERARILASGGQIKDDRLYGVLAVARSFGDIALKSKQQPVNLQLDISSNDSNLDVLKHAHAEALTAEPEMSHVEVTQYDEFIVMASDGLWDVCSNQKVVNFVRRRLKENACAQRASNDLVQEALELGAHDNITVVVCMLNQKA